MIAEDFTNNNPSVSSLSDAAQHFAGKSLFCKLDCSQAYHCFQMAEQGLLKMLVFNFTSRTSLLAGLNSVLQFNFNRIIYRWFRQHSSLISLHTRIESHGEDPSQNPGGCTKDAR